jgi:hypothetical protein
MKEIPLTQRKVALVDDEDYLELSKHKWHAQKDGKTFYASRSSPTDSPGKRRTLLMHTVIMGAAENLETDHINGDGLDNRKENLRIVTKRGNQQNRHQAKTSRFPGVRWHKIAKKWATEIQIKKRKHHLGLYDDEETAGIVYAIACNVMGAGVLS